MTLKVTLNASMRKEKNGKAKQIIKNDYIPAEVYGSKTENLNIKVKKFDFLHAFEKAGEFNLIDLIVEGEHTHKVIVKDVQIDAIKNNIIHVDFFQVDMHKKITTQIPLQFIGEARAVRELNGTLIKDMNSIEVRCLPSDLVNHIDVDLSKLNDLNDMIRLEDLNLPSGLELVSATNEVVVSAAEQKAVEEEKPTTTEVAAPVAGVTPTEEASGAEEKNKEVRSRK